MKTIIAGSRTVQDQRRVFEILDDLDFEITEVVCGCARGVDTMGAAWAKKCHIPVKHFPAEWDKYGKSAGYRRNAEIADYAEACVVIHKNTPGSLHMLKLAKEKGLTVYSIVV